MSRARGAVAGVLVALLTIGLGACTFGSTGPGRPGASGGASIAPGPSATTEPPPATFGPPPSPTGAAIAPLTIDPTLLAILPADLGGTTVSQDADEAAIALGNAVLPPIATGVNAAVALDSGSGDLVYVLLVRLREGALDAAGFGQWRDSYDAGACSSDGGLVATAEAIIADRTVYVGTCAATLHTYHAWLEADRILVSAWSLGERRLGEMLMRDLRTSA